MILDRMVTDELFGTPTESGEALIGELEKMSPTDYQALLQQVFPTAVAAVPNNVAVLDRRFAPVPIWSTETVPGREYRLASPRTALQGQTSRLTRARRPRSPHGPSSESRPGRLERTGHKNAATRQGEAASHQLDPGGNPGGTDHCLRHRAGVRRHPIAARHATRCLLEEWFDSGYTYSYKDMDGQNRRTRAGIELRLLRYFVTLAQELSFRKAAERLHITQPSLSHQIALLEKRLGLRLFQRDRRRVVLTDAGKALLDDARQLLAESSAIAQKAQRIAEADSAALRIGLPEYANRTVVPEIVAGFRRRHPEVRVGLREGYSRELLPELHSGALDIAFIRMPVAFDAADLMVEPVIDEEQGLLLAADHRLASCAKVQVGALDGELLLFIDRPVNPALYDEMARWFQRSRVHPRFVTNGGSGIYTYETMLQVIASGEAVTLSARTTARDLPPDVVYRPIDGPAPHFQVAAVWSATNTSPRVRDFLTVAREVRDAAATVVASMRET